MTSQFPMPATQFSPEKEHPTNEDWTKKLERLMRTDNTENSHKLGERNSLVFLHPGQENTRDYTDEEMIALKRRDFETRLFVTGSRCGENSVFMRTHHTDNHSLLSSASVYNFIRDYLKATHTTKTYTSAKATLARLLTVCFDMDESDFYNFAIIMASGLSENASNISFQMGELGGLNTMVAHSIHHTEENETKELKEDVMLLMHILFVKMQQYKFMIVDNGSNTYRLFHCYTASPNGDKVPLIYCLFSFLLQIGLTSYVIFQIYENFLQNKYIILTSGMTENADGNYYHMQNWNVPLACVTFFYAAILVRPSVQQTSDASCIFGKKVSFLRVLDFASNSLIPTILLFAGFFVIWGQDSFIDSVLNTAALLFIPDIDDNFPSLLGFKEDAIVKTFLISEAMAEFDALYAKNSRLKCKKARLTLLKEAKLFGVGAQFADHFITNWPAQGSNPSEGVLFQPYQVSKGKTAENGDQIDPSPLIHEKCLIGKLTWKYTVHKKYKNTSDPRVGYLKLEMLCGYTVEFERPPVEDVELSDPHVLTGVYIITAFQMSVDVLRLRVCGSKTATDFETAMNALSLWPFSWCARRALRKMKAEERSSTKKHRNLTESKTKWDLRSLMRYSPRDLKGDSGSEREFASLDV